MAKSLRRKTERMDLRATEDQKLVIERAAQIRQTTASEFMLQTAYAEAQRILEESSRIRLEQEAWTHFCAALDEPAKVFPALKEFLSQPDVFNPESA
jgi:uncharacterized protein (DUF1778 family)